MPPQSSITTNPKGLPGLIGTSSLQKNIVSAAQTEASAEMRFGIMVKIGATVDSCLLLTAVNNVLKGVVARDLVYDYPSQIGDIGVKPKNMVNIMFNGPIWVICEDAPVEGDEVHVRAVVAGAEIAGAFRPTADGTDTIDISAFARWTGRTDTVDGVIIAEVDLAMQNAGLAVADT